MGLLQLNRNKKKQRSEKLVKTIYVYLCVWINVCVCSIASLGDSYIQRNSKQA